MNFRNWIGGLAAVSLLLGGQLAEARQPELKFNKEGKFKIVQFTDVHMKYGNPASDVAIERMNEVLEAEKPDLVIFTGDMVWSKPAAEGLRRVMEPVVAHKVPFGVVYGNHDEEQGLSPEELYEVIKTIPYNITPDRVKGLSGFTNYILPVQASDGKKPAATLYCLDSHTYAQQKGVGGYAWFNFDQIHWFLENSAAITKRNGGTPLPALAFFHIPLPEYNEAASDETAILTGTRMEKACAPKLNSGMYTAMRQAGDVMATFVGHDHDNDYAVYWKGILLCYGRYTGGNTVYNNLPNGARVIELNEGERTFKTWIRLKDDQIVQISEYPKDFIKTKK